MGCGRVNLFPLAVVKVLHLLCSDRVVVFSPYALHSCGVCHVLQLLLSDVLHLFLCSNPIVVLFLNMFQILVMLLCSV